MKILDKVNSLDKRQQTVFILLFLGSAALLSIPLLFVNIRYDFHIYIILTISVSALVCCKGSGLFKDMKDDQKDAAAILVFFAAPALMVMIVARVANYDYLMKNFLIVLLPYLVLFFIFRNSVVCISAVSVVCMILYIANDVLTVVRGTALNLFDFLAVKTAFTVSSNYKYRITENVYYSFLCTLLLIAAAVVFPLKLKNVGKSFLKKLALIISAAALPLSSLWLYTEFANYDMLLNFSNQDSINSRGVCYRLALSVKDRFFEAPEGYSTEAANNILARYSEDEKGREPNIIVVMNESFADVNTVEYVVPSEEYMPFYCSLNENVTKGKAVVSCFGGGTSNSEFEFLTGMTMAFLPKNSYPYLQYVNNDINTLFRDLDSEIYSKDYIHPYIGSNYKRSSIFGFLGFDRFYDGLSFSTQDAYAETYSARNGFIDYEGADMVRGFISDKATYDKSIELYEAKPAGKKTSQFIVTMQNHSPYTYSSDDFASTVHLGTDDKVTEQYLSLIKISDSELERLVDYFAGEEEDTVIVFFGDHQPFLPVYPPSSAVSNMPYDKMITMYSTPFMIWTNFETDTEDIGYVSLNYLSALMKKKAGISLTKFDKFRLEMYEKYPVIGAVVTEDGSGNFYGSSALINDAVIEEYKYLQYYGLFDN